MNTLALITLDFNGSAQVFRRDGWFNMSKAAKHFGKDLSNFLRSVDAEAFLDVLSVNSTDKNFLHVQRGNGKLPTVGTWAHPKLAVFFARWLDERFAVWCDAMIKDILNGDVEVVTARPDESAVQVLEAVLQRWGPGPLRTYGPDSCA